MTRILPIVTAKGGGTEFGGKAYSRVAQLMRPVATVSKRHPVEFPNRYHGEFVRCGLGQVTVAFDGWWV